LTLKVGNGVGNEQRYAHLRDETLKKASTLAGNIIEQAAKTEDHKDETATA